MTSGWRAAMCVCRVCSNREVAIYPADIAEEDNQECGRCHAHASEPVFYVGQNGEHIEVER